MTRLSLLALIIASLVANAASYLRELRHQGDEVLARDGFAVSEAKASAGAAQSPPRLSLVQASALPPAAVPAAAPGPAAVPGLAPAPAAVPGPAPSEAPGPAAVPAPAATEAAAPAPAEAVTPIAEEAAAPAPAEAVTPIAEARQVLLTKRVKGLDYAKLTADAESKKAFTTLMKVVIAAQVGRAGHDIEENHIHISLSPGSVVVKAEIDASVPLPLNVMRSSICNNKDFDPKLLAALKSMTKIEAYQEGDIALDPTPECEGLVTTTAAAPTSGPVVAAVPAPAPALATKAGDEVCVPGCLPDRGICGDGVCFCRSPYMGDACEQEFKAESLSGLGWMAFSGILLASSVVGFGLADIVWKKVAQAPAVSAGGSSVKKESWIPQFK